ncbi:MAG: DNA-directed RNA polymerase subunit beta' [Novosphingobium sp.]|nr:DNA-directed RNA polymerase subunit beta' [Novosphingobium sp.]
MIEFRSQRDERTSNFEFIRVGIASPEKIREWSFGEVIKPETINYRSFKPEKDGLFCEKIFGPVKDWECHCGKYKRIRYRGVICDRCGVEVTLSKVRRERMGHIELAVPVAHIWFFKSLPSRMGYLLDMTLRDLEKVIYYANYVVIEPGNTAFEKKQLITEDEYLDTLEGSPEKFDAKIGAEAVRSMLAEIDISDLSEELRARAKIETSIHRKKNLLKRLKVVEALRHSENRPEWMIMTVVPVIPPDLRPLVPLEGGRFATSDLNDLYRRVINRNNRLKKLIEMRAPEVILRNEKRMLQESVDALFDNGRRSRAVRGRGKRPLKSLSDMLKGKQGRFRQNLLGKRVDYSGRSVIVVGPELKLHQCGLPKTMALELFKPFIIRKLEEKGHVQTVKSAKKLVESEDPVVWDILEEVIKDHPVLLNRAPTLHRLGIQAFEPILIEGKAIKIHPLVCQAFNADFDGDQMAVHLPLSYESQLEARVLMLSANNVLKPADGKPIAAPSQDIVLGCYYLTHEPREWAATKTTAGGETVPNVKMFSSDNEVEMAYENGAAKIHDRIRIRKDKRLIDTTVGRVIFNTIVPHGAVADGGGELIDIPFLNKEMTKNELNDVVSLVYARAGLRKCVEFLDALKTMGFKYATVAGTSVGIKDMMIPEAKKEILAKADASVEKITSQYKKGVITDGERYNKVIDVWTHANTDVSQAMFEGLRKNANGFNPIFMMADSGSRGSRDQIRQLAGMRGLMAKPQKKITGQIGEIIESPIKSNFREGLSVLEYFISTHGARKGLADTALKTADAGYLTRRLVDVAQDVTITSLDCQTILGLEISALKEGEEVIEPLRDRIVGSVALDDVVDPITDDLLIEAGLEITDDAAQAVEDAGIEKVRIRSVLTCEAQRGLCRMCYGRNLATLKPVDLGESVGIVAAQSIGEPGTQLTLRTFHIGGTASRIAAQSRKTATIAGQVEYERILTVETPTGEEIVTGREGQLLVKDPEGRIRSRLTVPYGAFIRVENGQRIEDDDLLFEWDPYSTPILTDKPGTVRFVDILEELSVREELDESTGLRQRVIVEDRDKSLHPRIQILDAKGEKIRDYIIPTGAHLLVRDAETVTAGQTMVKISREIYKTRDITGGLPRVAELFEARKPKDPAVITEIDGTVEFGKIVRGNRQLLVNPEQGEPREYLIPHGKHLRVHEGDVVRAGDRLSEGPVNPHDILRIKGPREVQEYLLNEIQEVYRLQGVKIHDKHIGVIVRQMLQKVRIVTPGDTDMLEDEGVDKVTFRRNNEEILKLPGEPATAEPRLLGITKAALSTESFISAASFQETTRVLTEAALSGKRDELIGLKENIIIGHLIPAGTGMLRYKVIEFEASRLEALAAEAERAAVLARAEAAARAAEEAAMEEGDEAAAAEAEAAAES